MSGVYSMTGGPTYRGSTQQELFDAALDQPLSMTATLFDQAKGGYLESFGAGTAFRGLVTPAGNEPTSLAEPIYGMAAIPIPGAYSLLRAGVQSLTDQGTPLDKPGYEASASYRKDVPWDQGMTDTRAAALAAQDDARKVREHYASKRPFSAFLGSMAGQALDPINYVPVFDEFVAAAAVARFGKVAGRAVAGSFDAAANTGIAGAVTTPERSKYGDDVSWAGLVSQIATAALIGGAFGTIGGALGARSDARVRSDAEQRLSTLRTTQEARIALNEGIDAVSRGEDVSLSPNSTEPMARVAGDIGKIEPPASSPTEGIISQRLRDAGRPPEEAAAAAKMVADFYATAAARSGMSVEDLISRAGLPEIHGPKSATLAPGAMFQSGEDRNLFVAHNIKPDGVLNASKIGGLPMPSLAIANIDKGGFDSFGEISLIADKSIVDPKQDRTARVHNADAYSPRYPGVTRDLDQKAFDAVNAQVKDAEMALGNDRNRGLDQSTIEDRGIAEARNSDGLKYLFLKENGVEFAPGKDWYENRKALDALMEGRSNEFADFVDAKLAGTVKRERIFKGFTNAGTRRYVEHTLANAFADMKSRLKEGEGFNYGVGSIRSRFAKIYKSITGIQEDRSKIVPPEDVKKIKEHFDDRFIALADEMRGHYRFDAKSFSYLDDLGAMIGEMPSKGVRVLDEGFKDLPAELIAKVKEFTADLSSAPTGYFEAKLNRTVGLDEFRAALVPTGTRHAVVDALKKHGIKIYEYDRSVPGSRADALRKVDAESNVPILFQKGAKGSIQIGEKTIISLFEKADASTTVHEAGHLFLGMFKDIAEQDAAPAGLKSDWKSVNDWWSQNADAVASDSPLPGIIGDDVRAVLERGTTGDHAKDVAINTGLHEQWARAFESYVRDGVAPTEGLRSAFKQFKEWLTGIYKQALDLNVKVTPELKQVFDRMLGGEDRRPSSIDNTKARPDPIPEGRKQAETAIARSDDSKALAAQYRVDPQTGSFHEEADVAQLAVEGRLTEEDAVNLAQAQADFETGAAYGEALKSVAGCLI